MVGKTLAPRRGGPAESVADILDSAEIAQLIAELEGLRWTGRKGYPTWALVGACLTKSLYAILTWSRTAALIAEHPVLQAAIGGCPSVYALYRFARKLRTHKPLLDACLDRVTAALREQLPGYGQDIAIDASDLPAFANGQRYVSKGGPERERFSDPDASWGHRSAVSTRKGGGFYGYKLHLATCCQTDLPVAWHVTTARRTSQTKSRGFSAPSRPASSSQKRSRSTKATTSTLSTKPATRPGPFPVIPLRKTPAVKQGKHLPPTCEHGVLGVRRDGLQAQANEVALPHRGLPAQSLWRKASRLHPLIPRETKRWEDLYRGRASVEREFGRLKHDYSLTPLRVRGLDASSYTPT